MRRLGAVGRAGSAACLERSEDGGVGGCHEVGITAHVW